MNSLALLITTIHVITTSITASPELLRGYEATPDPTSTSPFQSLLVDPTGNFSLCFLRIKTHHLTLAVVHLPSGSLLWTADLPRPAPWSKRTRFTFNGSLVISDHHPGAIWSTTPTTQIGERVVLSATSNLQILTSNSPIWQSFDFPSDTLIENQNFTSNMTLKSGNQQFQLKLGPNFIALYARFDNKDQIYFKHTAMEARARIIPGKGPIHIRISSDGYLGMYQNESNPVDLQPFTSYDRSVPGIRRIRLEADGNLKGYYWSGSGWESDFQAISDTCELPSPCGPYGLCRPGGGGCTCLEGKIKKGECDSGRVGGDLCGKEVRVLRREGVELPFKELMGFFVTTSFERCEEACASNCTCWGALYNNASGFCYKLDYPIQTLVEIGDKGRVGYFKVRPGVGSGGMSTVLGVLVGIGLIVAVGFGGHRVWRKRAGFGALNTYNKYVELSNR